MYRRIAIWGALWLSWGCSDGELQIETLDFDSVTVSQCGSVSNDTEIFFKINGDQALILDLGSPRLPSATTSLTLTIPTQVDLIYRIFDGTVSNTYFCSDLPPISPIVIEEIEASGGTLTIVSTLNEAGTEVTHVLTLDGVTLVNAQGERVTDLTISEFGTLVTTP